MATQFDYDAAIKSGYTPDEVNSFLQKDHPNFDVKAAQDSGYSPEEIGSFLSGQKPKQGGIRGELERKVAGPAAEFGLRAATSLAETGKGISYLLSKGVNEGINALGGPGLSDKRLNLSQKLAASLSPFGNVPDKKDIDSILKQVTGGRLEPTTASERILKGGAGILGDIAGFPGGVGAAIGTPTRAIGTAALAGTTPLLEEAGVPGWLALTGGIAADFLTKGTSALTKKALGIASKGISKSAGELAGRAARLTPSQVKQEVVDAGKRIGISQGELPLNSQVVSPMINGVETKLRESSLSGRHFEKQLGNVESKTRTAWEDIANNISSRQNLLPGAVSEEAITQLKDIEEGAANTYGSLYRQSSKALPEGAVADAKIGKGILNNLKQQMVSLSRGAGTPAKDAIKARLQRLYNDWSTRFPNGEIPIQDLIDLKKDLNEIIKYEIRGGIDKTLNPLQHMTRNAIQTYGRTQNTPFLNRFNQAEKSFGDSAKIFRKNKTIQSLLKTQNPQQILQKMRNVKDYRQLKEVFGRTEEGKQAFNDLSRYLLEDLIGSKLINKNGQVSWGNASGVLKNPKNREIVQEIIGADNYKKLKDIVKVSSGIEEGLKKFANPSGSATKGFDIAVILGTIGKGLGQIFSGQVIKGSKTMSYILLPRVMARLMTNPEFIQSMVDVAHAGRGTNPKLFYEAAERAARFVVPAIAESYPEEEKN